MNSREAVDTLRITSEEAFALARATSCAEPDSNVRKARARELIVVLADMVPLLEDLTDDPMVVELFGDAQLDIDYVLGDGDAPTSLRLAHVLPE